MTPEERERLYRVLAEFFRLVAAAIAGFFGGGASP